MQLKCFNYPEMRTAAPLPEESTAVHLWFADLDHTYHQGNQFQMLVPGYELMEAQKFRDSTRRLRFIKVRAITREILAWYCGKKPDDLSIKKAEWGKPYLPAGTGGTVPYFNISHCENQLVLGVCYRQSIGVDIERVRPVSAMDAIARRWLKYDPEYSFRTVFETLTPERFIRRWTRHEAAIKAMGKNLLCDEMSSVDKIETILSLQPRPGYWVAICTLRKSDDGPLIVLNKGALNY